MAKKVFGLESDVAGGVVLGIAALLGILAKNLPVTGEIYDAFLNLPTTAAIGEIKISKPLLLWINDGLMAIFFLVVALEIKREIVRGSLSTWSRAALPVYSAVGGMVVPALVFVGIVGIESAEARGWAIPAATDIAFAIGVLSLFGDKVPSTLKTFLLALAVVDDLLAILVIAFFYTEELSVNALILSAALTALLVFMNMRAVRREALYVLVGLALWVAVLKSGVHATIAGVILGFCIPLKADEEGFSLAQSWEDGLHEWSSFVIMPLFAFANAGVPIVGLTMEDFLQPITIAIAAGLFIGKQIGVFGTAFAVTRLKLAYLPDGVGLKKLYGVSMLAGIGFTMSLFIGSLAFTDPEQLNGVRIGVLVGSLLSGLVGAFFLMIAKDPEEVKWSENYTS
ncbi:Na+/H+ antiporter NhaA [Paracoccaceae bacterium GXU_MW_L88]